MRIVILGPFPPFRGGISHFNIALYRALTLHHTVLAINFTTQYPAVLFPGKTQYEENTVGEEIQAVRLLSSINPFTWFRTAKKIRSFGPDVILTSFWMSFFAPAYGMVLRWCRNREKPVRRITLFHNVFGHEKHIMDKGLLPYLLPVCDQAVTLSGSVTQDLKSLDYAKPIITAFHPIYDIFGSMINRDEAKISLGYSSNDKLILFFGYIRDYKGLDLFIEASRIVSDRGVQCKYLAVGESYIDTKVYTQLIKNVGMQKHFKLQVTFVPDSHVARYFSAADLVVCPYKSATQSGIIQIAYHFDRPVVVTRVGGLEQMVADGLSGQLADPTPESIADGIHEYLTQHSPEETESFIQSYKERFNWS
ncbi:MAG: glycosyltransferase, partial [Fidelibacterota bacterium]